MKTYSASQYFILKGTVGSCLLVPFKSELIWMFLGYLTVYENY